MLKQVSELQMGDAIGAPRGVLYVVSSRPEHTMQGTVKATLIFPPKVQGDEPRVERREWLHNDCMVNVLDRERAA